MVKKANSKKIVNNNFKRKNLVRYYRDLDTMPSVDSNCFFLAYQNIIPKTFKDKRKFVNNLNKGFLS